MALATRCPHCATTFRVAHDQLKLRAGLVRCGACKQIFNGVENLLGPELIPVDRPAATPPAATPPVAAAVPDPASPPAEASASDHSEVRSDEAGIAGSHFADGMPASAGSTAPSSLNLTAPTAFPAPPNPEHQTEQHADPLTRMTLMDFTAFEEAGLAPMRHGASEKEPSLASGHSNAGAPDEIEQAIEDLRRRPWRGENEHKENGSTESVSYEAYQEPDFVHRARRRQRVGHRLKWFYGVSGVLLALLLTAQLAYAFRDELAYRVPRLAPLLQQACNHLACRIGFPAPVNALAIESSELQALAAQANTFQLRVLLRNRYDTTAAWPHLELTLNDEQEQPVVRRHFPPRDYLNSPEQVQAGFAAHSEQVVNVHFVLQGEQASGFRVYLFYP